MRVVFLKSNAAATGGLELYTQRLAQMFAQSHDVTLLTTGKVGKQPFETLSLCETTKFSLQHIKRFDAKAQKWIEKHKPDLVFGMERNRFQTHYRAGSGVHAAYLERRRKKEKVAKRLSLAINPLHQQILKIEKEAFEHPQLQKLFVNSNMVKEEMLHYYNIAPEKLFVVHNGVEWEGCRATDQNDHYHFLFVGNDFRRKGLSTVLYAMRGLRGCQLTIVGKDKNASYFEKLAQKLQIPAHFVGPQADLKPFYEAADCLVLPTLYDPFANVTLEALAHGLFVVTSHDNGGKEILTPQSGIVTDDVQEALFYAQHYRRDPHKIRESVKHLTFENQLRRIVELC